MLGFDASHSQASSRDGSKLPASSSNRLMLLKIDADLRNIMRQMSLDSKIRFLN
jgi:hypothetical protein